jgi:hypothetical protein
VESPEWFVWVSYFVAFLKGDDDELRAMATMARKNPFCEDILVDPLDAMARLQLARALALSGDALKAKAAYDDFFTVWKNADPDIRLLTEARAEYARLP